MNTVIEYIKRIVWILVGIAVMVSLGAFSVAVLRGDFKVSSVVEVDERHQPPKLGSEGQSEDSDPDPGANSNLTEEGSEDSDPVANPNLTAEKPTGLVGLGLISGPSRTIGFKEMDAVVKAAGGTAGYEYIERSINHRTAGAIVVYQPRLVGVTGEGEIRSVVVTDLRYLDPVPEIPLGEGYLKDSVDSGKLQWAILVGGSDSGKPIRVLAPKEIGKIIQRDQWSDI